MSAEHSKASAAIKDEVDLASFDDLDTDYFEDSLSGADFAIHSVAPKNSVTWDESLGGGRAAVVRDSAVIADCGDLVSGSVGSPSAKKVNKEFFAVGR